MILAVLVVAACFLAFSNGANDNFKGVATIFGSGTAGYRASITWGTAATLAGSVASVFLAAALMKSFSGKGLVPDALTADPSFLASVAAGAGGTVILATRLGFPISTTHGLLGALVGAGSVGGVSQVNLAALENGFVVPLLLSPVLAIGLGALLYLLFHSLRWSLGWSKEWCVCVGLQEHVVAVPSGATMFAMLNPPSPLLAFASGEITRCSQRYSGSVVGIGAQTLIDAGHFLSAGVVSFARGLNDTPKMAALLLTVRWLDPTGDVALVAVGIAAGGLLGARRVAETMGHKITAMNPGQGLSSNLATAVLVLAASLKGLPVSTTHVSVGSLFGIGLTTRQANFRTIIGILLSWVVTLPCAAAIAACMFVLMRP